MLQLFDNGVDRIERRLKAEEYYQHINGFFDKEKKEKSNSASPLPHSFLFVFLNSSFIL